MQKLQLCTLNISTTCTGSNYTCYCTIQIKCLACNIQYFNNVHAFIYGLIYIKGIQYTTMGSIDTDSLWECPLCCLFSI